MWRFNCFQNGGRPPTWIFETRIFLMVCAVKGHILHQFTKFHKDRSNRYGDIAIFVIFQDGGRPPFLKTVKSLYLCNRLTDFDEIWHDDAYWPPTADRPLKFLIFKNSRWRQPLF